MMEILVNNWGIQTREGRFIPMRFSSYNILSPKMSTGDHVLLNGLKGTLDLIDEEAYDLIKAHEGDEELSDEVLNFIAEFQDDYVKRGYLTDLNNLEEVKKAREQAKEMIEAKYMDRWGIVLVPNLGCNYRCTYCFEKNEGYPERTMTKEQVDSIFEIIKDKLYPGENLTLYGGEPLDNKNRELIEYIVKKGNELDNTFFAVTNGHDLDHYMDMLGSEKISGVQITLDGPREIHNCRRIPLDKKSSYDKILSNVMTAIKHTDVQVRLRVNLDKRNLPYMVELLDELNEKEIFDSPNVSIVANAVVGEDNVLVTHTDICELEKAVEKEYPVFEGAFTCYSKICRNQILPALTFGEPVARNATPCGAYGTTKVFAPDGNIYSCWSTLGYPEHVIGKYDNNGKIIWNKKVLNSWKRRTVVYDKKCYSCKYVFLCSGGCRRPELPNEAHSNAKECDFYKNMFSDYLAKVTDEHLAARSE